jgi:ABC-type multidrug transport system ATPase subunit
MNVTITDLHKVYRGGVRALNGVQLTIPTGMFGLLGPNGAGKTTLMRILAGILRPTSGDVRVGEYDGATHQGQQAIKRILGYLPQDLGMYPDLSAREFLDYIGLLKGLDDRRTRYDRVENLLAMVALTDAANRKIKTLSGGMKRRVGIAQALLNDPQLLIVDEPTAGLDPEERIRFRNLLADLGGDRTVLLSTHIVEDIAQTCQRLAIMKSGRAVFAGATDELLRATRGHVWLITTPHAGARPQGDLAIISTLNVGAGAQYRVVGKPGPQWNAIPVEPSLEDAYVWFMRDGDSDALAHPITVSVRR